MNNVDDLSKWKIDVHWNFMDFVFSSWGYNLKNLSALNVYEIAELKKTHVFFRYFKEACLIALGGSIVVVIIMAIYSIFSPVRSEAYIVWPIIFTLFTFVFCILEPFILWNFRLRKLKNLAMTEIDRIEAVKHNIKEKEEEQAKWQRDLDREVERERRLSEVRHESTIMAMRSQVALYAEYKEKGLSVEKEIFEMREKLLKMEGEENKAMLDEIKTTLDSLA